MYKLANVGQGHDVQHSRWRHSIATTWLPILMATVIIAFQQFYIENNVTVKEEKQELFRTTETRL